MRNCLPLLCVLWLSSSACAEDDDHEHAREAVRRGELLSLERILALHPPRPGERLLEVEVEHEAGRWEYELELLGADGRVRELEIDGASGALLDEDEDD
ncbi:MAG: peptidase [Xanthomonadales bacterium]|nr:peptidase [Xanthomonadales bacterium]